MGDTEISVAKALDAAKSAHKRIDALEGEVKDLRALTLAVAKVDTKLENIKEDVGTIKVELQQVSARPMKWWDKLIAAALGAFASGIVAAILATILK